MLTNQGSVFVHAHDGENFFEEEFEVGSAACFQMLKQ